MERTRPLTPLEILRENALQILMYLLGMLILGLAWWPLAPLYAALALAGNIFYMAWVCPYCGHYALATCPAGFDQLSGGRFQAELGRTFRGQFGLGTLVLAPGWFLPPLAALYLLWTAFSWWLLALLAVFCLISFWLLPQASRSHCDGCETVDCPRRPKK